MATTRSAAPEASRAAAGAAGDAARVSLTGRAGRAVRVLTGRAAAVGRGVLRGLLAAALPPTCVVCGGWLPDGRDPACAACRALLDGRRRLPYCRRCGRTLPSSAIHADGCARCRTEAFWNVAAVARAGPYVGGLRDLVLDLKYRGHERNVEFLAGLLADELRESGWAAALDALVPVPMHWLRRCQRPCDHARLLAEALGRQLNVPVLRLVRRTRHAPSQTRQRGKLARFENVRGCFATHGWWRERLPGWARHWLRRWRALGLRGRTVCVVDNLIVAGATIHEVAKVLRKAGARRVYAAVVARGPAPGDPPAELPELGDLPLVAARSITS